LLRKEDPLSDAELIVLQRHPEIGFHMIESLGLGPVAEWVLHHHERWDGSDTRRNWQAIRSRSGRGSSSLPTPGTR